MSSDKLRQHICAEAARLIYLRPETDPVRARLAASRRLTGGYVQPRDLPTPREVRRQVQLLAQQQAGQGPGHPLRQQRLAALELMRLLRVFRPRLVGGVLSGQARPGGVIQLQLFAHAPQLVTPLLNQAGYDWQLAVRTVDVSGRRRQFTHLHLFGPRRFDLALYPRHKANRRFRSLKTGQALLRASISELEQLLSFEEANWPGEVELAPAAITTQSTPAAQAALPVDRFRAYQGLLQPLEQVRLGRRHLPEGDSLEHSLLVFDLVRQQVPYDEELLLAALLHEVGQAIDRGHPVPAALEALQGLITARTAWFIEQLPLALQFREGTLGQRSRRRLQAAADFEELRLLADADFQGRAKGMQVPELDEALTCLRDLSAMCGD